MSNRKNKKKITKKSEWMEFCYDTMDVTKRIAYNLDDPDDHIPIAMVVDSEGKTALIQLGGLPSKQMAYAALVEIAKELKAHSVATIFSCWSVRPSIEELRKHSPDGATDEEIAENLAENFAENYQGPAVRDHPDRVEGFMLWGAYGLEQFGLLVPYERTESGNIKKFLEEEIMNDGELIRNFLWEEAYNELFPERKDVIP